MSAEPESRILRGDVAKGVTLLALISGCLATLWLPPLRTSPAALPPPELLRDTICGELPALRDALAAAVGPSQEARVRPLTDGLSICADLAAGARPELLSRCLGEADARGCYAAGVLEAIEIALPLFGESLAAAHAAAGASGAPRAAAAPARRA